MRLSLEIVTYGKIRFLFIFFICVKFVNFGYIYNKIKHKRIYFRKSTLNNFRLGFLRKNKVDIKLFWSLSIRASSWSNACIDYKCSNMCSCFCITCRSHQGTKSGFKTKSSMSFRPIFSWLTRLIYFSIFKTTSACDLTYCHTYKTEATIDKLQEWFIVKWNNVFK